MADNSKLGLVLCNNAFYVCGLCRTGGMHKKAIDSHLRGCKHKTKVAAIDMGTRRSSAFIVSAQATLLVDKKWKHHVKSLLYDYIVRDQPSSLLKAEQVLKHYDLVLQTSLLELAVWKACCLSMDDVGSIHFTSMQDIVDHWAMDSSFDATEFKRQRRYAGGVGTIMQLVVPYLKSR